MDPDDECSNLEMVVIVLLGLMCICIVVAFFVYVGYSLARVILP